MNNITIEFCAEDRARLDKLIAALENATTTPKLTITKLNEGDPGYTPHEEKAPTQKKVSTAAEAVQAMKDFAEKTEKTAQDAQKAEAPTTAPQEEETPTATEDTASWDPINSFAQHGEKPEPKKEKPAVTLEQIQQKVMQLAVADGGAKKAKAREIISAYGAKVSDLKDQPEKWAEVWGKLTALEG